MARRPGRPAAPPVCAIRDISRKTGQRCRRRWCRTGGQSRRGRTARRRARNRPRAAPPARTGRRRWVVPAATRCRAPRIAEAQAEVARSPSRPARRKPASSPASRIASASTAMICVAVDVDARRRRRPVQRSASPSCAMPRSRAARERSAWRSCVEARRSRHSSSMLRPVGVRRRSPTTDAPARHEVGLVARRTDAAPSRAARRRRSTRPVGW